MEIQKWEYKILQLLPAQQEPRLNELGAKGWELTSALGHHVVDEALVLMLKRPAQLPSDIVFTSDLKKNQEDQIPEGNAYTQRLPSCPEMSKMSWVFTNSSPWRLHASLYGIAIRG